MAIFIDIHINVNLYDLFVWWLRNQELTLCQVRSSNIFSAKFQDMPVLNYHALENYTTEGTER